MLTIGIVTREYKSEEGHDIDVIYSDIVSAIYKNGGTPLGIVLNDNYKELIDICDGIVFQGGDSFEEYDKRALKYAYEVDKPVLGICLGMQLMGILFNGTMIDIIGHKKILNYAHSININKNSILYDILKTDYIKVNSRHKSVIKNTKLLVSALSNDGYIEAIEASDRKFFLGVQWHPENMIDYDEKQNSIFKYFIDSCNK